MPVSMVPKRELKALLKQLKKVGKPVLIVDKPKRAGEAQQVFVIWKGHEEAVDSSVMETR